MLNKLAKQINQANIDKGFYQDNQDVTNFLIEKGATPEMLETFKKTVTGQRLALITSEVSEALEGDRKNKNVVIEDKSLYSRLNNENFKSEFEQNIKDTVEDEIADTLIRVLDFCGANRIDIQFHVEQKLRYNSLRPHKHGKTY